MAEAGLGRLFVAIALASVLSPLNSTMIAVAVPPIARALQRDGADVAQALVTSYLVASIALQGPGGALGDRVGHRRALALGQALIAAGVTLGALSGGLAGLVAARVAMAVGGAIVVPCASAILRNELPSAQRGRAFGAFGGMMALAAVVGPLLGGALEVRFGFRAIFLVNLPLVAASALLAASARGGAASVAAGPVARFDGVGSGLLGAGLGLTALGGRLPRQGPVAVAVGVALLAVLAWHERRVERPIVDGRLLRRPAFGAGAAIMGLQNLVMYSFIFLMPRVWSAAQGLSARAAGRCLLPATAAMVLASPVAGRLADAVGPRGIARVGTAVTLAGLGLLAAVSERSSEVTSAALAVVALGVGLSTAPAQATAMSDAPARESGAAAGMLATARFLGGVVGITASGLSTAGRDAAAGLRATALCFLLPAGLALAASAWLPRQTRDGG